VVPGRSCEKCCAPSRRDGRAGSAACRRAGTAGAGAGAAAACPPEWTAAGQVTRCARERALHRGAPPQTRSRGRLRRLRDLRHAAARGRTPPTRARGEVPSRARRGDTPPGTRRRRWVRLRLLRTVEDSEGRSTCCRPREREVVRRAANDDASTSRSTRRERRTPHESFSAPQTKNAPQEPRGAPRRRRRPWARRCASDDHLRARTVKHQRGRSLFELPGTRSVPRKRVRATAPLRGVCPRAHLSKPARRAGSPKAARGGARRAVTRSRPGAAGRHAIPDQGREVQCSRR
jgi:hypothetical protein